MQRSSVAKVDDESRSARTAVFGTVFAAAGGLAVWIPSILTGGILGVAGLAFVREWTKRLAAPTRPAIEINDAVSALPPDIASFFRLYGMMAASDGQLTAAQIELLERFIKSLAPDEVFRWHALHEFGEGCQDAANYEVEADRFAHLLCHDHDWARAYCGTLCELALADSCLSPHEAAILEAVATAIFEDADEAALFLSEASQNAPRCLLDVEEEATDLEIEQAYQQKSARFHADALAAQGFPSETQSLARLQSRKLAAARDAMLAGLS